MSPLIHYDSRCLIIDTPRSGYRDRDPDTNRLTIVADSVLIVPLRALSTNSVHLGMTIATGFGLAAGGRAGRTAFGVPGLDISGSST